jgi:hypothetical protein
MITGFERLNSSATCWARSDHVHGEVRAAAVASARSHRHLLVALRAAPADRAEAAPTLTWLGLVLAEDVVDVVGAPPPAARASGRRGLAGCDRGVVEGHLLAGVALVDVLAFLDVVALNEAEVLQRASPCVSKGHYAVRFGFPVVIPLPGL